MPPPYTYAEIPEENISAGGALDVDLFDDLFEQSLAGISIPFFLRLTPQVSETGSAYPGTANKSWDWWRICWIFEVSSRNGFWTRPARRSLRT